MCKEVRKFRTLVKEDKIPGCKDYVKGRIAGIQYVMCDMANTVSHAVMETDAGFILTTKCSEEEYFEFAKVIEGTYTDMCEFDYRGAVGIS